MISDIGVEAQMAIQSWRDSQAEIDSVDYSDLIPALSRVLGWLNEGDQCEQKGMRVVAMLFVVRPDFIEQRSLGKMSQASRQSFDALVLDFRSTFTLRNSVNQAEKTLAINRKE
jgi:hypothetical protein